MGVVDCDLHAVVSSIDVLAPYLDAHWREVITTSQFKGPTDSPYPPNLATTTSPRWDAVDGAAPGTSVEALRAHVLDPGEVDVGVLVCSYGVESVRNPDAAAALAAAVNRWTTERWLDPEPRLRASITVPSSQPQLAVDEITRVAGSDDRFVQVYLPVRSAVPYGNRQWWPLLEAAVEHDLPLALHFGGAPGLPPTASGWPTYHVEDVVDMATAFQSQLTSLVAEGAFERFPTLRVALVESGFAWLPAFLWRFDKGWKGLRREIPWTKRLPSETVHEHVRLTVQPFDGPSQAEQVAQLLDQLDAEHMLLYASDYPHGHLAEGRDVLPAGLTPEATQRILSANARAFYRLGGDHG
jgi:predicted TIM-barrel fold metal-dependent hydrolase